MKTFGFASNFVVLLNLPHKPLHRLDNVVGNIGIYIEQICTRIVIQETTESNLESIDTAPSSLFLLNLLVSFWRRWVW
jgi:hypothetical protein